MKIGRPLSDLATFPQNHFIWRELRRVAKILSRDKVAVFYLCILLGMFGLAVFGPYIAPYDHDEAQYSDDGEFLRLSEPSIDHPLGTSNQGRDVLSLLIIGARPTILGGLLGGILTVSIGLTIGLVSGYMGGRIENLMMRFTDLVYGIPFLPFALMAIAVFGTGYYTAILIIAAIYWRGSARVIRSQVLQIKEREFILAAKATGAGSVYIMIRHIIPNVAPMAALFMGFGVGVTILMLAGLAFLGATDPFLPSWGIMVRNAYGIGSVRRVLWWMIPPGMMISVTVLSAIMLGRKLEALFGLEEDTELMA